jgi:DNA-binding CsgD family transcriptional regulator
MPPENRLVELTAREREVLDLVRLGLTNEEVAGRLGITEAGAKYHVSQILSKLGVATREEASAIAVHATATHVAEAFQARRGRWWAALPLAAKAVGVAVMLAAVVGLGVLAWGVLETQEPGESEPETSFASVSPRSPGATFKVLFSGSASGSRPDSDLFTIYADGSGLTNISNDASDDLSAHDLFPAWSPDASRIAFFSFERESVSPSPDDPKGTTSIQRSHLYISNADGTGRRRLAEWFQSHDNIPPVWSPDGSRIAFESQREEGNADIFVINVAGSGLRNITNHPAFDSGATWSSDSSRIAFASDRDGTSDIYVAGFDGSDPVRLTTSGARIPAWSPDGSRIAFISDRDGNSELYVMNSDGTAQVNLSQHPAADFSGAPVGHLPPIWSPDSVRIVFLSDRDGVSEIYSANANNSALIRLTKETTEDESPHSWSPDGADLIFFGGGSMYAIRATGEDEARLILDLDTLPSAPQQ